MAYSSLSIQQLITDITDKKYFLPAIQRKFVWGEEKICKLFNSIMRDYPIGTFLFWELPAEKADEYTFYEFLNIYHERDSKNKLVNYDFTREIKGVLDGQQRISSMYIALQGTYSTRQKHGRKVNDRAYPEKLFYLNLLGGENAYEFTFLTQEDSRNTKDKFYYLVRDILRKNEDADSDDIIDELIQLNPERTELLTHNRKIVKKNLNRLLKKFYDPQLISYFKIVNKDLDDILDIFVRVNSGGTILSKSDLLFSTLVAHWEDGREQIEKLIEDINGEDRLFNFNTDFLMRTCLFLIDAPMTFKVKSFDKSNISEIREKWENIVKALTQTSSMLREFGFNKTRLSSNYAATPIAYYLYKGGTVNQESKAELRKLVTHSLLKQVYSGQADSTLNGLRDGLRDRKVEGIPLKEKTFNFDSFKNTKLSGGKKLTIDSDNIDDFLEYKKGSFSFLLLSVLYPDLKIDQISFHQDHMHPHSGFKTKCLKELGLDEETISRWQNMRDQLPNLQLLEGLENSTDKHAMTLVNWVTKSTADEAYYRQRNYIQAEQSLLLTDFEKFFATRRQLLKEKLHQVFDVVVTNETMEFSE